VTKEKMIIRIIAGLLLGFFLSVSHADSPLAWEQLTDSEQQILKPYTDSWKKMSAGQQLRLQKVARHWQKMSAEQRAAMQQRLARWKQMPEEKKQKIREHYRQFEQFTPEQQQRMKQRVQMFRELPKQERQALRQQWQQKNPQLHNAINKQLRGKDDKKVISVKEIRRSDKDEEKIESDKPVEESNDSRLDSSSRMQNNRIKHQRINRPVRRTR